MMVVYFYNVAPGRPDELIEAFIDYLESKLGEIDINRSKEDAAAACQVFDSENNEHESAMSFEEWEKQRVKLKCYKNDVIEWVIAESPEDATKVLCSELGKNSEDCDDELDDDYWEEVPGTDELSIFNDRDLPEKGVKKKTVAEWIEIYGRSYLCSTEY